METFNHHACVQCADGDLDVDLLSLVSHSTVVRTLITDLTPPDVSGRAFAIPPIFTRSHVTDLLAIIGDPSIALNKLHTLGSAELSAVGALADFFDVTWVTKLVGKVANAGREGKYIPPWGCYHCGSTCDRNALRWFFLSCSRPTEQNHKACNRCASHHSTMCFKVCAACEDVDRQPGRKCGEGSKCVGCGTATGYVGGVLLWWCKQCSTVPKRNFHHCDRCNTNQHTRSITLCEPCAGSYCVIAYGISRFKESP
jgi:hypothetical protein